MQLNLQYALGSIDNYDMYLRLEENQILDLILLSELDDSLYHLSMTQETLNDGCKNIFGDVKGVFEHLLVNLETKKNVKVSDIGEIKLSDSIEKAGRNIVLECSFSAVRILDPNAKCMHLLQIIKQRKRFEADRKSKHQKQSIQLQSKKVEIRGSYKLPNAGKSNRVRLTLDADYNPNIKYFQKHGEEITISEPSQNRIKLFFNQIIPNNQKVYFTVKIISLKQNVFSIGLIDQKQNRQSRRSFSSFSFQFATGQIKDTNSNYDKIQPIWRETGNYCFDFNNAVLKMQVDKSEGKMWYYINDNIVGKSQLNRYLMERDIVPYVNVKNKGDKFVLNAE